jgi:hypothetical protein
MNILELSNGDDGQGDGDVRGLVCGQDCNGDDDLTG